MRDLLQHHPTIGYRFVPGLKARVIHESGGYLIRANETGFRSQREYVAAKEPGKRRILLFGDSVTAGDGVANRKRYCDVLETLIPNLEVYNYGLPGSGTDQQYLAYKEYAQGIDHDLLIVAVFVENIRRITAKYRFWFDDSAEKVLYAKPYFELVGGELSLHGVPVPSKPLDGSQLSLEEQKGIARSSRFPALTKLVSRLGIQAGAKELIKKVTKYQPFPEYNDAHNPAWSLMRAILMRWIEEHPKPVLVMPIPAHNYVEEMSDPAGYQARFREISQATGCFLHDPLEDLMKYSLEERRSFRFAKDPHPTEAGHAALAKSLQPAVSRIFGD
jgi:hypothetical protein